jgi:hypothetical protein
VPPPADEPRGHYLFPQNRKAWDIALACVRRMEVVPFVGVTGFDNDRLRIAFERYDVDLGDEEVWAKVDLLEDFFVKRFRRDTDSKPRGGGKGEKWLNM